MSQVLHWRIWYDSSWTYLNIKAKTSDTVLGPKEESEKEGETQREKISPTRQGGLKKMSA